MILLLLLPLYGFAAVENTAKSDTVTTDSVKKRRVVLRTNLLYWATLSPNLSVDFRVGNHWSLGLNYGRNFIPLRNTVEHPHTRRLRHRFISPEVRYWTKGTFEPRSWFFGLNGIYSQYNVSRLLGIVYPSLKDHQEEKQGQLASEPTRSSKAALKIGIALAIVSALFDGADSFVSSVLIGDSIVDSMDFIAANTLVQVIISVFVWIYLWIRHKKIYNPFRKIEKYRFVSQAFSAAGDLFYIYALSGDALLGVVLWNAFPILDILGARILMKEKLTRPQYLVLFILIIGAVLVSIS